MNMMPIQPVWWDIAGLVITFSGFLLLALTSDREAKLLLHRKPTSRERLIWRLLGWLLLMTALLIGIAGWYLNYGVFLWFGWLTVAATALVFILPYWPWRQNQPERTKRTAQDGRPTSTSASALRHIWNGSLMVCLIAIPAGFAWALYRSPEHPLLREDAFKGQIGLWRFTLVEEHKAPPVEIGNDTLAKHFMLRFCDACDAQIRDVYLKVRRPRLPLSVGRGFEGKRWEREVTLVIPPAANADDGIWLTAVGTDGVIHQTRIDLRALSPATARFLQERSQ